MKKLIILTPLLALFLLPNLSSAKSEYRTFTNKQFKIKYSTKAWKKKTKKKFVTLKFKKNKKKIKLRIKQASINKKGQTHLNELKKKKFGKIYKKSIRKQFKNLSPKYKKAKTYTIENTGYKVIKLNFNLNPGKLKAYYITDQKTLYHRIVSICKKNKCKKYNKKFKKLVNSFRTELIFQGAETAESTSTSSITLSWDAATTAMANKNGIEYYIYQANQLESEDYTSPTYISAKNVISQKIDSLQQGTSYYYVARARDKYGNMDDNTEEAIATTKVASNNDPTTTGSIQYVSYQSNGSTVLARMYKPPGDGPFPVIIYNHGGVTASNPLTWDGRINQLRQGNTYAVLATAYRGDVGSGGTLSPLIADVNDILAAIEYVKSKSYIDSNRIGVFGESRGGNTTLSAISRNNTDPKAVVTWYPITDTTTYCEYIGSNYCLTYYNFYTGPRTFDHYLRISSPVNFASKMTMPLQNSHGTADLVVPYSQSEELNAAMIGMPNYTFYSYPGSGHGTGEFLPGGIPDTRRNDFFNNNL